MNIHHLRNATFVIETGELHLLIDPMLSEVGALPPFAWFRHKARRNPLVSLPINAPSILKKVTHCLVTHSQKWGIEALTHTDHFDTAGREFLRERNIPVICPKQDAPYMQKHELEVLCAPGPWQTEPCLGGSITAVPALHGHSWMHAFMANGAGFFLDLPEEPTIYISGDTVYTPDVEKALTTLKPDVAVMAAGNASLDIGGSILMPMEETLRFIHTAPGLVIANHLDALNHCPVSRAELQQIIMENNLQDKTLIPDDGETLAVPVRPQVSNAVEP